MPYLTTTGSQPTDIFYEDLGSGRPVVLIHGWPLSLRMWDGQVNALLDAGHRVVSYDRRGFGNSDHPAAGYDYDTFASDLHDLIEQLDLRDVTLAGFSMGGGEVARYIGRFGEGRLARAMLLGAVPPLLLETDDNPGAVPASVFDGMLAGVKADRIGFLAGFFEKFFGRNEGTGVSDEVVRWAMTTAGRASQLAVQECINAFGRTDFRGDLARVTIPLLVVHGDADQIVPLEISGKRAAEQVASSEYHVLAGAPHAFTATHGEELNRLMVGFLEG